MRVLGMSSGTSVDAIDLAVAEFSGDGELLRLRPIGHAERAWPDWLRTELLAALPPASVDVATWCRLDTLTGQAFGNAAAWAISQLGPIDLIASHGQTLYHWVAEGRARGSLQIGAPAWIHAATGVPVISDLRSADIAAGGQGAPLASTLDALWLGDRPTAALNLGGIANVTLLGPDRALTSGDTGPASCLLDAAAQREYGLPADLDGRLAAAGVVDTAALELLLADGHYARPLPKSTGREYFHADYVAARLGAAAPTGPDLFATLTELTARSIAGVINPARVERVVASGGGLHNPTLLARLRELLDMPLLTSTELGLPADAKEAYLFALLGHLSAHGLAGTLPGATGASEPTVLGSLTPPTSLGLASHAHVRRLEVVAQEDQ